MAIQNLSGNFQPALADGGRSLPRPASREPSTDKAESEKGLSVVASANQAQALNLAEEVNADKPLEDKQAFESQIEQLQEFNQSIDRSLQFKVDEELGVTIVRVIDKNTDELIRQFPPEELINLSKRLKELNEDNTGNSGILLQEKV